jgi:hypothetical protein
MTTTVPGMRSNKLMSMDIDQLRGWAALMDKAMIASLIATILAVVALGITTWQSFKYGAAVRAHEQATVDRYKGIESQSGQLAQDVAAARDRAAALEREVSSAQGRTAALEQEMSAARERAVALEQQASAARERAVAFEQAARDANERAARAARESAAASEKAASEKSVSDKAASEKAASDKAASEKAASDKAAAPSLDAAAIQQRVADLAKLVREATARATDQAQGSAAETPRPVQGAGTPEVAAASSTEQPSPIVAGLRKYAGTKAAVFVLDQVSDAPAVGSTISGYLGDAGWAPQTWTWTGVAGLFGVTVLVKEGSDAATNEAASTLVETLRTAGFNATKGDWPAGWHRFRGTLNGPQMPAATDAPIRIVIGAKPR